MVVIDDTTVDKQHGCQLYQDTFALARIKNGSENYQMRSDIALERFSLA